ncbi:MAG: hypothetical protein ABSF96_11910 [Steroidobacteraceae bacterium]|jgi:hypothetical protein
MRAWRFGLTILTLAILAGVRAAGAADAAADDAYPAPQPNASPISDHFALSGIYFLGHVSTTGYINPSNGLAGTYFSAEHDLGVTDQAYQPRIEIMFRLEQRGRLRVDFFDLRRNGDVFVDRNIQYGNVTFLTGDQVQSSFNWRQMDLTYTYSFLRNERFELGAGLGVNLIEAEASAQIPGTPNRADFTGATPFATIAFDGTWAISRFWSLNARAQYLDLSTGSISGALGEYHADVQYRWRRNVAFGLGYDRFLADLTVRDHNPSGLLDLMIRGPQAFVRVSF